MGTVLGGRDEIDVTLGHGVVIVRQPANGPFRLFAAAFEMTGKWLFGDDVVVTQFF